MKNLHILLFSLLLLAGCNNKASNSANDGTTDSTNISDAPRVGGDRDEHGCIASAGYQWSQIKNECVRLFEAGVRLKAVGTGMDSTLAAYVIISDDGSRAELFLPSEKAAKIMERKGDDETAVWESGSLQLSSTGGYVLTNGTKLLYQSKQ